MGVKAPRLFTNEGTTGTFYQRIVLNTESGLLRREKLEGRWHVVVPAAILAEGVIAGSAGPILYENPELAKSVPRWNHRPIVVYHPEKDGTPISACVPEVLNTRKIGVTLNSTHDNKLRTECWLDEQRTPEVHDGILPKVKNFESVEMSTGLFAVNDGTKGKWNDLDYVGRAVDHSPDHLAILPDKVGAYSVAMGGGLFANQALTDEQFETWNRSFTDDQRRLMAVNGQAMKDGSFPVANEEDLKNAIRAVRRAKDQTAVKRHVVTRAWALGLVPLIPDDWRKVTNDAQLLAVNELSFSDIQYKIQELLAAEYGKPGKYWSGYVCEVYEDRAIFRGEYNPESPYGDEYWMVNYTVSGDTVSLDGEAVKVEKVFQPVNNGAKDPVEKKETLNMEKKGLVDSVIANGGGRWKEEDREELMKLPDAMLQRMAQAPVPLNTNAGVTPANSAQQQTGAGAAGVAPANVAQGGAQPMTTEQYIANAPPGVREILAGALQVQNAQRARMVKEILAHPRNRFAEKDLMSAPLPNLEALHALAQGGPMQYNNEYQPLFGDGASPIVNYLGAAGGTAGGAPHPEQGLPAPTMKFDSIYGDKK